ncbi:MAG: cell division protein FtsL [Deltaproteobacteria bacterium]|nr:cell division protein FtsL [Deltaproteobacteria bacterium]
MSRGPTGPFRLKTRIFLAPSRRAAVLTLLMAMALGVSAAVAQVWTHQQTLEFGYEISRLAQERNQLQERHRRLRIELELLKSPKRIGQIAATRYGMRPPEPEQMRRLRTIERKRDPVVGSLGRQKHASSARQQMGVGEHL